MTTAAGFALFDTAIGACGVAWKGFVLTGVQLPERTPDAALARLRRRFAPATESPPPRAVQAAIEGMKALLSGEPRDLSDVELDLEAVPPFNREVYAVARGIPPGETLTYGEIAARIGQPHAAQAVGKALGQNPFPIVVPCHRVLAAGGKTGGFSADGGVRTKLRLLAIEGAVIGGQPGLFDALDRAGPDLTPKPTPRT